MERVKVCPWSSGSSLLAILGWTFLFRMVPHPFLFWRFGRDFDTSSLVSSALVHSLILMSRLVRTLSYFLVRDFVKSLSLRSLVGGCGNGLIKAFNMPHLVGEFLTKFIS